MTGAEGFLVRVVEVREEAHGVKSFVIEASDGAPLPVWAPGAHVDLDLTASLSRQYSLCGDPADRTSLRFAVLREPTSRGGSILLHDEIAPGDSLRVVGVRNAFPIIAADRYLLIAGGIGVTPLLAMARELERQGKDWHLLYGGRTRASMAFLSELEVYGDKVQVRPEDEFGLLNLAAFLGSAESGQVAYCCGPEPLIKAVESHCAAWPEDLLQIERFRPKEQAMVGTDTSFEVELRTSGITITVPADQSIADALDAVGFHIPRSCNEGTCGTCLTKVIEGLPDHRDSFLRPKQQAKNDRMLVCCSRSLTPRLVLDA
jgi:ferredoxin-NADP reductase